MNFLALFALCLRFYFTLAQDLIWLFTSHCVKSCAFALILGTILPQHFSAKAQDLTQPTAVSSLNSCANAIFLRKQSA